MTICINLCGAGMITPLGDHPPAVLQAIEQRKHAAVSELATTGEMQTFAVRRVPADVCADVSRMPRLRRASPISNFATAAAMRCLDDAGLEPGEIAGPDTALVFAASDGSVEYTRRFFAGVNENGPGQGSPLLFPETVYNAPASHVAAALGLTGHAISLVGDSAVAIEACVVAGQLLFSGSARRVLVIAAEELDALAVAGYAAWGISTALPNSNGVIFGEGAAALLLEKQTSSLQASPSQFSISVAPGKCYYSLLQAGRRLKALLQNISHEMKTRPSIAVGSDAGGSVARLEDGLFKRIFSEVDMMYPRIFLGDGLTAASLWQIVLAREMLRGKSNVDRDVAICSVAGHNGQLAACLIHRNAV